MKRILVLFALFAAAAGYAQTVEKQTFVYAVKQTDTLRLDRYVALTPDSRTKPCLMFVFGGGFVGGRRDNASFLSYFEYYARKGYVVVSIDYRLGMKKAMQAGTLSEETFPKLGSRPLRWRPATSTTLRPTSASMRPRGAWTKPGSWQAVRAPEPLRC